MKPEYYIKKQSVHFTNTPFTAVKSFPFYITEAGYFYKKPDYYLNREYHNSFLLLYTLKGGGYVKSDAGEYILKEGECSVINCRNPHIYHTYDNIWEFLWIHFDGDSVKNMINILSLQKPVYMQQKDDFVNLLFDILSGITENDIISSLQTSLKMHTAINLICQNTVYSRQNLNNLKRDKYIDTAANYIKNNYFKPLTVDDIIKEIPISKYHFIRSFEEAMGVTPYSYLLNCRITNAKILLHSTDKSISEIAFECGFPDTSNFIMHFKKSAKISPLKYRNSFYQN